MWYAMFNPTDDITIYELSRCLAIFGDLSKTIEIYNGVYKMMTESPESFIRHIQFRNFK